MAINRNYKKIASALLILAAYILAVVFYYHMDVSHRLTANEFFFATLCSSIPLGILGILGAPPTKRPELGNTLMFAGVIVALFFPSSPMISDMAIYTAGLGVVVLGIFVKRF